MSTAATKFALRILGINKIFFKKIVENDRLQTIYIIGGYYAKTS